MRDRPQTIPALQTTGLSDIFEPTNFEVQRGMAIATMGIKALRAILRTTRRRPTAETASRVPTGFFDLPGELRNIIYTYAAAASEDRLVIWVNRPNGGKRSLAGSTPGTTANLALLHVSHQVCSEALPFVFGVAQVGLFARIQPRFWTRYWGVRGVRGVRGFRVVYRLGGIRSKINHFTTLLEPGLGFIKHLRVVGEGPLKFVVLTPSMLAEIKEATDDVSVKRWRLNRWPVWHVILSSLQGISTLLQHLPNATCVTLTVNEGNLPDLGFQQWLGDEFNSMWLYITREGNRSDINGVFTKLRDFRYEYNQQTFRFRVGSDGEWTYWYSGRNIRN
ncbi:hypothetical protein LTR37_019675 [Vermiconidia calcicola]|uniref:Uncharacterized protein n=1 Tax=Vermiconidia calcicola TaxID=1690605 RepID=A0ACC3MFC5_9PEZI|nr:hypothetical protein LTR37_019675 [Vermiconidia calcicola]